jgi:SAM-dependent methyltransferase
MAAWYRERMREGRGTNPLKNQVEVDLCARYAKGPDVLDVGIGTGRASLPLARAGYQVTGVDSSQAMLDETRGLAGATPIRLKTGDVAKLDFGDASFDTVLSLNVLVHFPHWREVLAEWKRVVRPGGRLVFDIHSQDHEDAARAAKRLPPILEREHMDFHSRMRVAELADAADALGLRIVAVTPYIGGNVNTWFEGTLAQGPRLTRLLSWLGSDADLYAFALFLEHSVYAYLTSRATGRFMVALDNVADTVANRVWLEQDERLNRALSGHFDPVELSHLIPAFDTQWQEQLNRHLDHPRNRLLFFFLWSAFWAFPDGPDPLVFLETAHAERFRAWRRAARIDAATTASLRDFVSDPRFAEAFSVEGVDLRAGLEYELTGEMLANYHKAFAQQ